MIAKIGDCARDWNETKNAIKTGNVIPNTHKKIKYGN